MGVNIYDPISTVCVAGVCTRTQFSDPSRGTAANPQGLNIIPAARISAISKVYQSLFPAPTSTGVANNYLGQVPVGYNNDSFNIKVDYDLTTISVFQDCILMAREVSPGHTEKSAPPFRSLRCRCPTRARGWLRKSRPCTR